MAKSKQFYYKTGWYTVNQLSAMSGIGYQVISRRLRDGWCVAEAVETPPISAPVPELIDPKWWGKTLLVTFPNMIPDVFARMQPRKNQTYVAQPHQGTIPSSRSRLFYTITLDNGKPLIVYPQEFEILAEA